MDKRAEMNRMRDAELERVRRDMDREKQVGTMKRGPRGRPKKPKTMMTRNELNKMRNELLKEMTKDIKQILKPKKLKVVGKAKKIKLKKGSDLAKAKGKK